MVGSAVALLLLDRAGPKPSHSEALLSESGPACGQSLRCLAAACGTQALGGLRRLSLLGVGGDGPTAHIWGHLR